MDEGCCEVISFATLGFVFWACQWNQLLPKKLNGEPCKAKVLVTAQGPEVSWKILLLWLQMLGFYFVPLVQFFPADFSVPSFPPPLVTNLKRGSLLSPTPTTPLQSSTCLLTAGRPLLDSSAGLEHSTRHSGIDSICAAFLSLVLGLAVPAHLPRTVAGNWAQLRGFTKCWSINLSRNPVSTSASQYWVPVWNIFPSTELYIKLLKSCWNDGLLICTWKSQQNQGWTKNDKTGGNAFHYLLGPSSWVFQSLNNSWMKTGNQPCWFLQSGHHPPETKVGFVLAKLCSRFNIRCNGIMRCLFNTCTEHTITYM